MDISEYKKTVIALRPTLLSIAKRIVRNEQDAEDIVQEVCLRMWHLRHDLGKYKNTEAYCVVMTKNSCIDKIRGQRVFSDENALTTKTDDKQLPDQLLEEKENSLLIRQIIQKLPPLQQQIVRLKDIEGYETEEIAETLGIAAEAVRNNLSRARKRVREMYLAYNQTIETKKQ